MAIKVNAEEFNKAVQSGNAVVADFYSDSCVPCKRMSPVLSQLENEFQDRIQVIKVNVNFEQELAEKYGVQAVPTLILFKDGEEVNRIRGAVRKDELISETQKLFI